MKYEIQVENEADIEATITITTSLDEWERLSKQLSRDHPSWKLSEAISSMLHRFRTRISGSKE